MRQSTSVFCKPANTTLVLCFITNGNSYHLCPLNCNTLTSKSKYPVLYQTNTNTFHLRLHITTNWSPVSISSSTSEQAIMPVLYTVAIDYICPPSRAVCNKWRDLFSLHHNKWKHLFSLHHNKPQHLSLATATRQGNIVRWLGEIYDTQVDS